MTGIADHPLSPCAKRPRLSSSLAAGSAELVQYPLAAREKECAVLDRFLERCLAAPGEEDGAPRGGCLYISGSPGTGKTQSVRAATMAWRRRSPETKVIELNCMDLEQKSPSGVLRRVEELARAQSSGTGTRPRKLPRAGSITGLASATAAQLAQAGRLVVVIADEVDQLVKRSKGQCGHQDGSGNALEALLSLPACPGAPRLAVVAIANAVDLLERILVPASPNPCESLLFESYTVEQLRKIAQAQFAAAGAHGAAKLQALGRTPLELRIRQIAKHSGDCREVVNFCEQVLCDTDPAHGLPQPSSKPSPPPLLPPQATARDVPAAIAHADTPAAAGSAAPQTPQAVPRATVQTPSKRSLKYQRSDPLQIVQELPMGQQVLLCALAGAGKEAVKFLDVYSRYRELCKRLHQPIDLASKEQVSSGLSALEQRGLLALHMKRAGGPGKGGRLGVSDCVAELSVSQEAVRERVAEVSPMLEKCLMSSA